MAFEFDGDADWGPSREPSPDAARTPKYGRHPDVRRGISSCPELDCVRHVLPPGILSAAEWRAGRIGVGADRVLIAAGYIDEAVYLRCLAAFIGVGFSRLNTLRRSMCPLPDERLLEAPAAGFLPVSSARGLCYVVAPRGLEARRLIALVRAKPQLRSRLCLTPSTSLTQFVIEAVPHSLGCRASELLKNARPDLSAATANPKARRWLAVSCVQFIVLAAGLSFEAFVSTASILFSILFFAWIALRLLGAASSATIVSRAPPRRERRLPVYTIVVALHDETRAVPGLVRALRRLNYPPEKLDIKFVLEPDDHATAAALERHAGRLPFEVIMAPDAGPTTKPKALNAALPFARGEFLAVYDAEDRPECDQLLVALEAFDAAGEEVACVQAALTIDNTRDSWLTRLFTAEYAGLFDVLLPGLASRGWPLPLGGSSNHFRTAVLRRIGGWDPYNVTEDADLGIRLARFGYHTDVIASTTYEEAPTRLVPWLRQRTRWFKGWMQTWLVHMRKPAELFQQLGPAGFVVFQLVVGGTVLASLVHPIFIVAFAAALITDTLLPVKDGLLGAALVSLYGTTLIAGYLTSSALGMMGLLQRQLLGSAWVLLLMPVHWILLSIAAWRAVLQLLRDPFRWEKTEHGLARTSRLAAAKRRR